MAETNPCKCADPSVGPTKSTATSFSFQVCDGMELVSVPATNIANYIIDVIYGDTEGNPPDEGCYNVCYDDEGNRSISLVSAPRLQNEYVLQNQELLFPIGGGANDQDRWALPNPSFFAFTQQPPAGFVPTYAKLKFTSNFGGSSYKIIEILDKYENPVYRMTGSNDDDDGAHTGEVWVPVDDNNGAIGVFLSGVSGRASVSIKLVGFSNAPILQANGDIIGDIGDGSDGGGNTVTPDADPDALEITYIEHQCNVGNDITIIEFAKDVTLLEGTDDYTIQIDFGGNEIRDVIFPHATSASSRQRLTVTWTVDKALRVEAKVKSPNGEGEVKSSNTGDIDNTIVLAKDISAQVI